MNRPTRMVLAACVTSLLLLGTGAVTASAGPAVKCGQVITSNTKLTKNVGPCAGNGIVVKRSNITLNLNGFKVYASNGPEETVGILLPGVRSTTVKNGTVQGFDAGIALMGGSKNTITGIAARDNINDNIASDNPDNECTYGDGITATNSDGNRIRKNSLIHNGPFSGISLVEDSDNNLVKQNVVTNNNVPNEDAAPGIQGNGECGSPFSRPVQDIGIRVEGPGANDNTVEKNRVINSAIGGITIHGYQFNPPPSPGGTQRPPDSPNTGNLISKNYVADTGKETYKVDPLADGIGVLRQGPGGVVGVSQDNTIAKNTVVNSFRHGIFLGDPRCGLVGPPGQRVQSCQPGPFGGTTVTKNVVQDSLFDGIRVAGPATSPGSEGSPGSINNTLSRNTADHNGEHDGHDDNAGCDNNAWLKNKFDFVNQQCVDSRATVGSPSP